MEFEGLKPGRERLAEGQPVDNSFLSMLWVWEGVEPA